MNGNFVTFLDIFFNADDAYYWLDNHIHEHHPSDWEISAFEILLLESGAYRAGVSFRKREAQLELGV